MNHQNRPQNDVRDSRHIVTGDPPGGALGPLDDLSRRRAIEYIVNQSFEEPRLSLDDDGWYQRPWLKWIGTVAAASILGLVFVFLSDHREEERNKLNRPTGIGAPMAAPKLASPSVSSQICLSAKNTDRAADLPHRVELLLQKGSAICYQSEQKGELTIVLNDGTIWVSVPPIPIDPLRVSVDTSRGEVHVKGTIFSVKESVHATDVLVLEGQVETIVSSGAVHSVQAGRRYRMNETSTAAISLTEQQSGWGRLGRYGIAGMRAPVFQTDEKASLSNKETPKAANVQLKTNVEKAHGEMQRHDTPQALLLKARAERREKKWPDADHTLSQLIKQYPKSEEAIVAQVVLGRLKVERLGRPQDALGLLNTHLSNPANLELREEALYWLARAYQSLGNRVKECETLKQYTRRYQKGPLATGAMNRLRQIGKTTNAGIECPF